MKDPVTLSDNLAVTQGKGMESPVKTYINVHAVLRDNEGNLKYEERGANLVTTAGKQHIADQLSSSPGGAAMSHMAVGTGSVAAAIGDTGLGTEVDRNALTSRTDSGAVVTYVADWAAGDATNSALREAGIFNAASSGTLLARYVFASAIDKQASDTLQISWTLTIG